MQNVFSGAHKNSPQNKGGFYFSQRECVLQPILWVPPVLGDIVHQQGNEQKDNSTRACGNEGVEIAEAVDLGPSDHGDQGCCTARRVKGFRRKHNYDGKRYCQGSSEPDRAAEELIASHSGKARQDVPSDQISRLCKRTFYRRVHEDR